MSEPQPSRVALVTGASAGIGRATAIAFAQAGCRVVLAARRSAEGQAVVDTIKAAGGAAMFVQTDVSKAAEVKYLIDQTLATYGRLDWACNNAGIEGTPATIPDCPEELWDEVVNTNLKGVWLCMKYEIPAMLAVGGGAIVNISSANGFIGAPGFAPYTASKHGVIGLTKSAAKEFGRAGIRINTVCPGSTDTPMIQRLDGGPPTPDSWRITLTPLQRIAAPEEIANAVVWLCSAGASYVTGQTLVVDGGLLA